MTESPMAVAENTTNTTDLPRPTTEDAGGDLLPPCDPECEEKKLVEAIKDKVRTLLARSVGAHHRLMKKLKDGISASSDAVSLVRDSNDVNSELVARLMSIVDDVHTLSGDAAEEKKGVNKNAEGALKYIEGLSKEASKFERDLAAAQAEKSPSDKFYKENAIENALEANAEAVESLTKLLDKRDQLHKSMNALMNATSALHSEVDEGLEHSDLETFYKNATDLLQRAKLSKIAEIKAEAKALQVRSAAENAARGVGVEPLTDIMQDRKQQQ